MKWEVKRWKRTKIQVIFFTTPQHHFSLCSLLFFLFLKKPLLKISLSLPPPGNLRSFLFSRLPFFSFFFLPLFVPSFASQPSSATHPICRPQSSPLESRQRKTKKIILIPRSPAPRVGEWGWSTNMPLFGRVHECKEYEHWNKKKVWIASGMKWTLPKNQGDPHRDTSETQTHSG